MIPDLLLDAGGVHDPGGIKCVAEEIAPLPLWSRRLRQMRLQWRPEPRKCRGCPVLAKLRGDGRTGVSQEALCCVDSELVGHEGTDGFPEGMNGFGIGFALALSHLVRALQVRHNADAYVRLQLRGRGARARNVLFLTV